MKHYSCEFCNCPLDIDDGTCCAFCFADHHKEKPKEAKPETEQLLKWLNDPTISEFFDAVKKEIAFQKSTCENMDRLKNDTMVFWLCGKLLSKALENKEKRKHHIITTVATLYLWFHK